MQYGKEWLNIANAALSMVSSNLLTKLDEGTVEANYVNVQLPAAVDQVYSEVNFYDLAITEELPREDDKKVHPLLSYCYKLPENYAKILSIRTLPCQVYWELSQGSVCTDAEHVVCQYVTLPTTPADMPPYARNLVTLKLAALLASPLSHDYSLAQTLESKYTQALSNALTFSTAGRFQEDHSEPYWTENPLWGEE